MKGTATTMAFADNLDDLIKESGKDIRTLSKEIGISTGALSNYRSDGAEPGINNLKKIATYFNVSYDYLLDNCRAKRPENSEISKELGLTDEAIEMIKKFDEVGKGTGWNVLQFSLTDMHFVEMLLNIFNSTECSFEKSTDFAESQRFMPISQLDKYVKNTDLSELKKVYGGGSVILSNRHFQEYSAYQAQLALNHLIEDARIDFANKGGLTDATENNP